MSGVDRLGVLARERIRKRVAAALEGEEYSVIEMAHDLERLASHPVWEEHDRAAADLEGAVEENEELREALLDVAQTSDEHERLAKAERALTHPGGQS